MQPGQIFALVWAAIAIVGGSAVIVGRHRIARLAHEDRERRGSAFGSRTQTPRGLAILGGAFVVIGLAIVVTTVVVALR